LPFVSVPEEQIPELVIRYTGGGTTGPPPVNDILHILSAAGAILALPVMDAAGGVPPRPPLLAWTDPEVGAPASPPDAAAVAWVWKAARFANEWALPTATSGWLVPHLWTRLDGGVDWDVVQRLVQALAFHLCERPGLSEVGWRLGMTRTAGQRVGIEVVSHMWSLPLFLYSQAEALLGLYPAVNVFDARVS
jgi:hypothetical protein